MLAQELTSNFVDFNTTINLTGNKKTGKMPVTTQSYITCPKACPLNGNGCFAQNFPMSLHWDKVTNGERGIKFDQLIDSIKAFPAKQLWRYAAAGDLPGLGDSIDSIALKRIIKANDYKSKKGFTYTHKPIDKIGEAYAIKNGAKIGSFNIEDNRKAVIDSNKNGFTVNISAHNVDHAINIKERYNLPVTTIVPLDQPNYSKINGHKIVCCPHEKNKKLTCDKCGLCQLSERDYIIAFRVHGAKKRHAQETIEETKKSLKLINLTNI